MRNKVVRSKKKIILVIIVLAILISVGTYFGIRTININKYTKANEYEVKEAKIPSVKTVLGEKKVKKYSYKKNTTEILELEFEDSNKEQSAKEYLDYIKDNGNYIEMNTENNNTRQIASPGADIITVQTELTEIGFKVIIEVGPGEMKMDYTE